MTDPDKRERPLGLDMDTDEAFERFLQTDPKELPDRATLKKKKPPPKRGPGVGKKARPKPKA
ncbi:MAG: hypothetical protein JJE34_03400 [Alphaproteobacteria bacterium]|nr:hypothetical protein [Alphaproteobacteria bacterium]